MNINLGRFHSVCVFLIAILGLSLTSLSASAAIIATDNFESYTPGAIITGGTAGSESPETTPGGTGWDNSDGGWDSTNDPNNDDVGAATIVKRTVTDASSGIDGQSLILEAGTNAQNMATRRFPAQTGTFYIGMDLKTDDNWADSFFQLYVNDTRANSPTSGMGGGINRDSTPGPGPWFARTSSTTVGGSTLDPTSVHRFVMGFSKSSGNPLDNYDTVKVWVDSFDPLSPDAEVSSPWTGATMSVLHYRINNQPGLGDTIMADNLVVASTLNEAAGIPEPSSLLALLMSLPCIFYYMRGRK